MAAFILDEPYASCWRKAYLRVSKDGRKRLDLFNDNIDRTTTAYSRYLMAVSLGRFLTEDEEVDHIDKDVTNDDLSNLQVLSVSEHLKKTMSEIKPARITSLECPVCKNYFDFPLRNLKFRPSPCCSRRCGGKKSHITKATTQVSH